MILFDSDSYEIPAWSVPLGKGSGGRVMKDSYVGCGRGGRVKKDTLEVG